MKKKDNINCAELHRRLSLNSAVDRVDRALQSCSASYFYFIEIEGGHNSALEDRDQVMLQMKETPQNKAMEPVSGEEAKSSQCFVSDNIAEWRPYIL